MAVRRGFGVWLPGPGDMRFSGWAALLPLPLLPPPPPPPLLLLVLLLVLLAVLAGPLAVVSCAAPFATSRLWPAPTDCSPALFGIAFCFGVLDCGGALACSAITLFRCATHDPAPGQARKDKTRRPAGPKRQNDVRANARTRVNKPTLPFQLENF